MRRLARTSQMESRNLGEYKRVTAAYRDRSLLIAGKKDQGMTSVGRCGIERFDPGGITLRERGRGHWVPGYLGTCQPVM